MSAIDAAIPEAGQPDRTKLGLIDADTLARYVLDVAKPWWRRRACAEAMRARVPETHVAALHERIRDPEETSEIRITLLDLIGSRPELLPWLQQAPDGRYGLPEQILSTRAKLGDLSAASTLATAAASLRERSREQAELALDDLVAVHGLAAVERAIGNDRPEGRLFANRMRSRERADLTPALADPDVGVARRACELIISTGIPDDEMLLDHVVTGPTLAARLFAAYALDRRGREIDDLWRALDAPRVEVAGLPEDVRGALVRTYPGETRCDPRWLLERACVELPEPPDEAAQLERATTALIGAGLTPSSPLSAEDVNGTGDGTFHQIDIGRTVVLISTLGAFATGPDDESRGNPARHPLEAAGFRWIDDELGKLVVPGLPVYYFGQRDPLDVRTLLYYWQD